MPAKAPPKAAVPAVPSGGAEPEPAPAATEEGVCRNSTLRAWLAALVLVLTPVWVSQVPPASAATDAVLAARFARFDTNADGVLGVDEVANLMAEMGFAADVRAQAHPDENASILPDLPGGCCGGRAGTSRR